MPLNRITMFDRQKWFATRRLMISAQHMNNEVGLLRDILEFARDNGWMMHDPTSKLERLNLCPPNPDRPTAAEFRRLVATLRSHRDRDAGDLLSNSWPTRGCAC
jgi:hypothetical protein